jgi:hypothetical protein
MSMMQNILLRRHRHNATMPCYIKLQREQPNIQEAFGIIKKTTEDNSVSLLVLQSIICESMGVKFSISVDC